MNKQHDERYRRETAALPEDRTLQILCEGWQHGVNGLLELGFPLDRIAKAMAAFIATCFASKGDAAVFFSAYAAGLRAAEAEEQQQGPQLVN